MPSIQDITGIILLGGHSRRMGTPKHSLRIGGETLLQRQIRLLESLGCPQILLSGRADQVADARLVVDAIADQGPMGGLASVLPQVTRPWSLILAVDLPDLDHPFLQRLLADAATDCGVVPEDPDGLHPLCALYPTAATARAAQACLASGRLALQPMVRQLIAEGHLRPQSHAARPRALRNWNTPVDAEAPSPARRPDEPEQ